MMRCETNYNKTTQIWAGPKTREFFNPQITLGEVVRYFLERNHAKIGQICDTDGSRLTNAELMMKGLKIATFLKKNYQLTADDMVAVVGRNTQNLAPVVFGIWFLGVTVNTLDASFDEADVSNIFHHTQPKLIICDDDRQGVIELSLSKLGSKVPIHTMHGINADSTQKSVLDMLALIKDEEAQALAPNTAIDGRFHTAIVVCTAGATAACKAVAIPHSSLIHLPHARIVNESDVALCFSSLYWLQGVVALVGGTITGTTRLITSEPYSPELMLRLIEKYKVTSLLSPPNQLVLMMKSPELKKRDISSLTQYYCGGSNIPPYFVNELHHHLKRKVLSEGYGTSELGGSGAVNLLSPVSGSVGRLMENVEMRVVDKDEKNLGPNENGELYIQVRYPFLGYIGQKVESDDAFFEEGWIRTGDYGHFDDNGYLYIIDRKKDIMINEKTLVAPNELEDTILEIPDVMHVCVVGVTEKNQEVKKPAALIVLRNGSKLTKADVEKHVSKRLSDAKSLHGGIFFVKEIPATPAGKFKRYLAKKTVDHLLGNVSGTVISQQLK